MNIIFPEEEVAVLMEMYLPYCFLNLLSIAFMDTSRGDFSTISLIVLKMFSVDTSSLLRDVIGINLNVCSECILVF